MKKIIRNEKWAWQFRISRGLTTSIFSLSILCIHSISTSQAATVINLATPVGGQITDLVGYYTLNSVVSGTVADTSGLSPAYNGTLNSAAGTLPASAVGVNIAGTSGYGNGLSFSNPTFDTTTKQGNVLTAATTSSTPMDLAGTNFTLGMWIKMDSIESGVQQTAWLLDKKNGSGGGNGWAVSLTKKANDLWTVSILGNSGSAVTNDLTAFGDLQWHNIGISFDDTSDTVVFYIDGVAVTNHANTMTTVAASTAALMIGQRNTATAGLGTNFNMEMDDVFISNGLHTFAAVPEPSTIALIALAGGLAIFRRRKE